MRGGHRFISYDQYSAEKDKADIFILYNPFDSTEIPNCREHTRLIIAMPLTLIRYTNSVWDPAKVGFEIFAPDYYLIDSWLYKEVKDRIRNPDIMIEMGNAKFDGIYEASKEKRYWENWKKLKGKRTILWATTHGVSRGFVTHQITFDLYAKQILEYATKNLGIGFILRPHSSFIRELLENGYWSRDDLDKMVEYCACTPNVVWDTSDSYDMAYSVSDAILTDAFCGIAVSALPTLKPICLMYRSDMDAEKYQEDIDKDIYYLAHNEKEVIGFLEMVKNGQDDLYELRKEASKKYVKNFDGKNGERIKQFIEQKYQEKIAQE